VATLLGYVYDGVYTELNPPEENRTYTSLLTDGSSESSVLNYEGAACAADNDASWIVEIDLGSEVDIYGIAIGGRVFNAVSEYVDAF
jgi:hypothetical protein